MGADHSANFAAVKDFAFCGAGKAFPDNPMTGEECLRLLECNYNPLKVPSMNEWVDPRTGKKTLVKGNRYFNVIRDDTGHQMGQVGSKFQPVAPRDAVDFMDSLSEKGEVRYLAGCELDKGAKICLFAQIPGIRWEVIPGDEVGGFMMLSLTNDGNSSVLGGAWGGRFACMNMIPTLQRNIRAGNGIRIRHSGDIEKKLEEASRVLRGVTEELEETKLAAEHLAKQECNQHYVQTLVDRILPLPEDPDTVPTKRENQRKVLFDLVESGRGTGIRGVRGTRWGLLNAVTEYTNHERNAHNEQTRLNSLVSGSSNKINQDAFRFLMDLED